MEIGNSVGSISTLLSVFLSRQLFMIVCAVGVLNWLVFTLFLMNLADVVVSQGQF